MSSFLVSLWLMRQKKKLGYNPHFDEDYTPDLSVDAGGIITDIQGPHLESSTAVSNNYATHLCVFLYPSLLPSLFSFPVIRLSWKGERLEPSTPGSWSWFSTHAPNHRHYCSGNTHFIHQQITALLMESCSVYGVSRRVKSLSYY